MTVATLISPARTTGTARHDPDARERRDHYQRTWGKQPCYIEVVAGATTTEMHDRGWPTIGEPDPDTIDLLMWTRNTYDQAKATRMPHTRKFFHWPDQADALDRYVVKLLKAWGNVFVGVSGYADASRKHPLPGRVILVEDGKPSPAIQPSYRVQTSSSSYHDSYIVSADLSPDELTQLARDLTAALGGDPSGVDRQQLTRVPTTYNTKAKYGAPFRVCLIEQDGPTYTPDDLRAQIRALRPTERHVDNTSSSTRADWKDWSAWPATERHLTNIEKLHDRDKLPSRLTARSQTRRILAGEETWSDTSGQRFAVARGLMLHGYPDEEIAALLIHHCDYGAIEQKGSDWLYADVYAIITRLRSEHADIRPTPTRIDQPQPARPLRVVKRKSRARTDRPQRHTPATYWTWLQQRWDATTPDGPVVLMNRRQRAAAAGVSTATLDRLEDALEADGLIAIRTYKDRSGSQVVLLGVINTPSTPPKSVAAEVLSEGAPSPITMPEIDPGPCAKEHTPPIAPVLSAEPVPAPAAGVGVGVDANAPGGAGVAVRPGARHDLSGEKAIGRPRPPSLGELVHLALDDDSRASLRKVRNYLADNWPGHPWSAGAVKRTYQAEVERRRRERDLARIRALRWPQLKKKATSAGQQAARLRSKDANAWRWWNWYAGQLEAEITRRLEAGETPPEKEPRWRARNTPTRSEARAVSSGGCVPPTALSGVRQSGLFEGLGLPAVVGLVEQPRERKEVLS